MNDCVVEAVEPCDKVYDACVTSVVETPDFTQHFIKSNFNTVKSRRGEKPKAGAMERKTV